MNTVLGINYAYSFLFLFQDKQVASMQLYLALDYVFSKWKIPNEKFQMKNVFKRWYSVFPASKEYLISINLSADTEGYIYVLIAE